MNCIFENTGTLADGDDTTVHFRCINCGQERYRRLTNPTPLEIKRAQKPLININCGVEE